MSRSPLRDAWIEAGLCADCGRLTHGHYHCPKCREKNAARAMRSYLRRHPNAVTGRRRCTICRRKGHIRSRCPSKEARTT